PTGSTRRPPGIFPRGYRPLPHRVSKLPSFLTDSSATHRDSVEIGPHRRVVEEPQLVRAGLERLVDREGAGRTPVPGGGEADRDRRPAVDAELAGPGSAV